MKRTDTPQPQPTPAPLIGTPAEQTTQHQPPAPTPAEHTTAFRATRPGDCVTDH
ncbi:MAG: hypothetical protein HOW97_34205 [Catenulispora sp.]|nr:hypothetical protein [Catenulispora sp.]